MVDLTPNHVTTANCLIMAVLCSINHYKSIYLLKICDEINYIHSILTPQQPTMKFKKDGT